MSLQTAYSDMKLEAGGREGSFNEIKCKEANIKLKCINKKQTYLFSVSFLLLIAVLRSLRDSCSTISSKSVSNSIFQADDILNL